MSVKIYGIKNCDTMKKAFKFFEERGASYDFHDYKKLGVPEDVLRGAIDKHGWDKVINRRGTSWRQLAEDIKSTMNGESAFEAALDNPSLIKRPLLEHKGEIILGFDEAIYTDVLSKR